MPNAKTEHSKNLRALSSKKFYDKLRKNGEIKTLLVHIKEPELILMLSKISNKTIWVKKALKLLNEHGEIK